MDGFFWIGATAIPTMSSSSRESVEARSRMAGAVTTAEASTRAAASSSSRTRSASNEAAARAGGAVGGATEAGAGCLSVAPDFGAAGGVEFFVVGRGIDGRTLALMTGPTASDVPLGRDSESACKPPESTCNEESSPPSAKDHFAPRWIRTPDTTAYQKRVLSTELLKLSTLKNPFGIVMIQPTSCSQIDWDVWMPTDRATLLFVIDEPRILLIEKKRGLGAGKVNGPGGRIDPGESAQDCALREIHEELGVRPLGEVHEHGELFFQFINDGYKLHCRVFRADGGCDREPIETNEAAPLWTNLDAIPFERMWADDALWLPIMIAGDHFRGRFIFDGDRMVDHDLVRIPFTK